MNDTGRGQAENLRLELVRRQVDFTAALSSPLDRALETARILLAGSDIQIRVEPALAELDLGHYEGRYESDVKVSMGAVYER